MSEPRRVLRVLRLAALLAAAVLGGAGPGRAEGPICGAADILGERIALIDGPGPCGIRDPVRVRSVAGVALDPPPELSCAAAAALAAWLGQGAKPAVARAGGRLEGLEIAAAYVCRNRNNAAEGRVSEHAFGRAIDVSGFRLASGRLVGVASGWRDPEDGPMLARIHAAGCGPFATTLGPGSDGFHEDHFHYDVEKRPSGPYCR